MRRLVPFAIGMGIVAYAVPWPFTRCWPSGACAAPQIASGPVAIAANRRRCARTLVVETFFCQLTPDDARSKGSNLDAHVFAHP